MIVNLHLIALALYGLATVFVLAPLIGGRLRATPRALTIALPCAGAAFHVVAISRLTPIGLGPALSMLAFCLVLLQLASERLLRGSAVSFFAGPLATGLVGLAILSGLTPGAGLTGAGSGSQSAWFILHVALSALGLSLMALAFIAAALYLLQFRELKSRRFGQIFQLFPPLERLDQLNHLALVAGFPALTMGVLLALGYGAQFSGGLHAAKAQIVWGVFTWVVLGWAVWVRVVRHWAGRRAAVASIAGFGAVLLVYVALKLTQPGAERFL
ncbi:MAG TPA: cytochrome c biogenesis protein CcsA [Gemmatimonadales bacterium]|nr:cytochrome c biogenesis protein CcsA [Gemmatimonadales bacterium]